MNYHWTGAMRMDAIYYRRLAREIMAAAAATKNPAKAARLRVRAQEYLVLAEALDESAPPLAPASQPEQPLAQQQQIQPKKDKGR